MGDTVQCGYHGLAFDGTGQCVHNPFPDKIPAAAKVQSWAVIERHDIIWLWGGSPDEVNPALIPDFSMITNSSTVKAVHGYTLIDAPSTSRMAWARTTASSATGFLWLS